MIILLKFTTSKQDAVHILSYEGITINRREALDIIERREMTTEYACRTIGDSFEICAVGSMPDYYILIDIFRLPKDNMSYEISRWTTA